MVELRPCASRRQWQAGSLRVWHVQPASLAEMTSASTARPARSRTPSPGTPSTSYWILSRTNRPFVPKPRKFCAIARQAETPPTAVFPSVFPADGLVSEPNKIVQSPKVIVILYESDGTHRQIYTDGRALPNEIEQPSWLGYSAGKWDHDTLVVETAGFNDKTWLDLGGHPHSEALRIVERYHRRDFGHMDVEMTFDDPRMYTKPFTIKFTEELWADSDLFEYFCNENEKDRAHSGPN